MQNTQNVIHAVNASGVQDEKVVVFMLMLFLAIIFMISMYISFKLAIGRFLIKSKKKKVLNRIKEIKKNNPKAKFIVHSSDKNGIPTLIETENTHEFL